MAEEWGQNITMGIPVFREGWWVGITTPPISSNCQYRSQNSSQHTVEFCPIAPVPSISAKSVVWWEKHGLWNQTDLGSNPDSTTTCLVDRLLRGRNGTYLSGSVISIILDSI